MSIFNEQCPYCGTQLSVECNDNDELTTTCSHCNKQIHMKIIGKQPYVITEDLYQLGETLPYEKKKDRWVSFRNWFITLNNNFSKMSAAAKAAIIALIVLAIGVPIAYPIITAPADIEQTLAYDDMENLWQDFRSKNPYNYQTVGIRHYDDDSYNVIISEPSNDISEEDLEKFFKKYNCNLQTFKQAMGYDGWLKDVVVCFNGIKSERIPNMTNKLFELLYGTSYKATLMDFDTIPSHLAYSSESLNYQVSEEEIRSWFIDEKETLVSINDASKATSIVDALNAKMSGESELYYSKEPGFVVWVINRSSNLGKEDFMLKSRMFSIDSDLIFGAIANSNRVAIIARERSIPVYQLPPMRQEMLLVLASTKKDELSQSYERNNLFAGKLKGGKDYAPILLSDELWHTEYGNILNITDQMLKSWSENGKIEYHAFTYPKPFDWAFDDGVIHDLGFNELTYNWNTAGAGYIMDGDDGLRIYAVNRTGSLPVSYIPGDTDDIQEDSPIFLAEESAYDFYSNLSSPELVKVVQYASMYQIFTNFGIHVKSDVYSYPNSVTTENLDVKAYEILNSLCNLKKPYSSSGHDDAQVQKIRQYYQEKSQNIDKESLRKELAADFDEDFAKYKDIWYLLSDNSYYTDRSRYVNSTLKDVQEYYEKSADELLSTLDTIIDLIYENKDVVVGTKPFLRVVGHYLINPRDVDFDAIVENDYLTDDQYCQYTALLVNSYAKQLKQYNEIMHIASLEETKAIYLEENKEKSLGWQKCPTIVESWDLEDSVTSTGGHNLNSSVTPIKVNESLKPGQYKVSVDGKTGRKVIEISSADRGKVTPSFLRNVERTNIRGVQEFRIPSETVRPRTKVMAGAERRSARGFNTTDHLTISRKSEGFVVNGKKVTTMDGLMEEINKCIEAGDDIPFKTLELKDISESEQIAVIDKIKEVPLTKSRELSSIPKKSFDVSKIITTNLEDGTTLVKIPINAETVRIEASRQTLASFGGFSANRESVWGRIKAAWYEFKVPSAKIEEFKAVLRDFFKDPKGTWSKFQFEHKLKSKGFDKIEIRELYEMQDAVETNIKVAQLLIDKNLDHHA